MPMLDCRGGLFGHLRRCVSQRRSQQLGKGRALKTSPVHMKEGRLGCQSQSHWSDTAVALC